jgi:hypothetical protein
MDVNKQKFIGDVRKQLARHFASGLARSVPEIADRLYEQSGKNADKDRQRDLMAARDLILARIPDLERQLASDYAKRFDEKLAGEAAGFSKTMVFSLDSLSLVDDAEVQENILLGNVSGRLKEACGYELFALTKRLEFLTDREAIADNDSPVLPRVFCRALLTALTALGATPQARYDIFAASEASLNGTLVASMAEVNEYLISNAVLIEIVQVYGKPILRRPGPRQAGATGQAGSGGGTIGGAVGGDGGFAAGGYGGDAGGGGSAQADNVLELITRLLSQSGYAAAPGPAMTGAPAGAPLTGSGVPMGAAVAASLPPGEMATPPAGAVGGGVAAVAVPPLNPQILEVLNRLATLQIKEIESTPPPVDPALAATVPMSAMTDEMIAGLSQPAEPLPTNVVRQARAELSEELPPAQGVITDVVAGFFDRIFEAPEISPGIKALIGRLQLQTLKASIQDPAIFTDLSHPLRAFMDKLADLGMKRSTSLKRGDPTFDQLSQIVESLSTHFDTDPDAVKNANVELDVLIETEEARALEVIVDSVSKVQEQEKIELAHALAAFDVSSRLDAGTYPESVKVFAVRYWQPLLASEHLASGEDSEQRKADLATLDDLLWSVLPVDSPEDRQKLLKLVPQLAGRLSDGLDRVGIAREERDAFFHFLANLHSVALRKPATKPAAAKKAPPPISATQGQLDLTPAPTAVDPRSQMRKRSSSIERGQWIEMRDDAGKVQRCRLSWISPLKETFVFKNYDNKQAVTLSTADFQALLKSGDIKLIDDASITERSLVGAIKTVMETAPAAKPAV